LVGVYLTFADATGANFAVANLANSYIRFGIVPDFDFTGANLAEVNFEGADLSRADLTEANLTGAWLTNATLREATLVGANLTDADLTGTTIAATNMGTAIFCRMIMPDGAVNNSGCP
jgi:uncharacterized protein YjbI with pentapeptide repeats